mmetsp:Transcript_15512/g.42311  ORF Transcript_15512/g.42311 Transcript_15512/m.42311 type:complete len:206 (-) Transcript_15512:417-1034(-)
MSCAASLAASSRMARDGCASGLDSPGARSSSSRFSWNVTAASETGGTASSATHISAASSRLACCDTVAVCRSGWVVSAVSSGSHPRPSDPPLAAYRTALNHSSVESFAASSTALRSKGAAHLGAVLDARTPAMASAAAHLAPRSPSAKAPVDRGASSVSATTFGATRVNSPKSLAHATTKLPMSWLSSHILVRGHGLPLMSEPAP